jgi:SAM-dependent methyltransferase
VSNFLEWRKGERKVTSSLKIPVINDGVRILNIGCGPETWGTDFVDLYPMRKEVVRCNVDKEKLPYPDDTFDIVYSRNIFEHMMNPGFLFRQMIRVLKKGGKLILVTDNSSYYLFNLTKGLSPHYDKYEKWSGQKGEEDRHYMVFTTKHIENFCKASGVRIVRLKLITQFDPPDTFFKYPIPQSRLKYVNRIVAFFLPLMGYPRIYLEAIK